MTTKGGGNATLPTFVAVREPRPHDHRLRARSFREPVRLRRQPVVLHVRITCRIGRALQSRKRIERSRHLAPLQQPAMLLARCAQSAQCDTRAVQRVNRVPATLIVRGSTRVDVGRARAPPIAAGMLQLQQPVQRDDPRTFCRGARKCAREQLGDLITTQRFSGAHVSSLASTNTSALPSSWYVTVTFHGRQHT